MSTPLLRGKRLRVTRLDECCAPMPTGTECSSSVTSGFVSVAMSPEYEDGAEVTQVNANGDQCLTFKDDSQLKRIGTSLVMCGVDFSIVELLTGDRLEVDDEGLPIGIRSVMGKPTNRFAIEVWSGVEGGDACETGVGMSYGYFLLPCLGSGRVGEITIEDGPINVTIENAFTKGGGGWGVGPYPVIMANGQPGPLTVPIAKDEPRLMRITTVPPPPPTDGCVAMPDVNELTMFYSGASDSSDLATLSSDPVSGDTGTGKPYRSGVNTDPTFASGQYVTLGDGTLAHWNGSGWVVGAAA